jgi:hypothetical protein
MSSGVFTLASYTIQPGLSATSPWGCDIARLYETYQYESLSFVYEPVCPSTTQGSVLSAIEYDVTDLPPTNKQDLMSMWGATRSSPWTQIRVKADPNDLVKFTGRGGQLFVRSSEDVSGSDRKTYDCGKVYFAVDNFVGTSITVGEIYIEYSLKLFTPQPKSAIPIPPIPPPGSPESQTFKQNNAALGTTVSTPFFGATSTAGSTNIVTTNATAVVSPPAAEASRLVFQEAGSFMITTLVNATSGALPASTDVLFTVTPDTGITPHSDTWHVSDGSQYATISQIVTVTAAGLGITFTPTAAALVSGLIVKVVNRVSQWRSPALGSLDED